MSYVFNRKDYPADDFFYYNEYIETNCSGGWASATLSGANTRRYHGLFVSAFDHQSDRLVLVSKFDETLIIGESRYELGTNHYGNTVSPNGTQYIDEFKRDLYPEWLYAAGGVIIRKTIAGIACENTVIIQYELLTGHQPVALEFLPLIAGRDYHSLIRKNGSIQEKLVAGKDHWQYQPYDAKTQFYIQLENAVFEPRPNWYYNFYYKAEDERGQDFTEDLFSPGIFKVTLAPGKPLFVVFTDETNVKDAPALFLSERKRRMDLLKDLAVDDFSFTLLLACDQFLIEGKGKQKSVIAGYHWFSDWGRDTMISLPGLCYVTKRFAEAKKILTNFSQFVKQGIIPNRFSDNNGKPEYNTVDASLWFFIAAFKYYQYTRDKDFICENLETVFGNIVDWYEKGTLYHIHAERDGLLFAGEDGVQLTWMDAKVDDWVVTPRTGKAVEINALWYNALMIYAHFLSECGRTVASETLLKKASKVKDAFVDQFWFEKGGYLYDVISDVLKDDRFRPNQIFALSLPFKLIEGRRALMVFEKIRGKLYTPNGLRSLAPDANGYEPYYFGNQYQRDGAYHQGTVWSWLLGPYTDCLMALYPEEGKTMAQMVIKNVTPHLKEAGIGSISEIFDATAPFYPKGCIAQAWGVAEILRVYIEYRLYR